MPYQTPWLPYASHQPIFQPYEQPRMPPVQGYSAVYNFTQNKLGLKQASVFRTSKALLPR